MPTPATGEKQPKSVATVLEYVDAAFNPDFYLAVRFVSAGAETPKRKVVVAKVEQWLAGFRWDDFRDASGMRQPGPEAEVTIDDWVIGLKAIPRSPIARGDRSFPTIGFYPGGAAWVEAVVAATGPTLDEKASKYGDLDAPYLLAAWVMSPLASESSLAYALFGAEVPVELGRHAITVPSERTGLWTPDRPRRGRVSGVLFAGSWDFNYSSVSRVMPRFWPNPWANRPLEIVLPFPTSRVSSDETFVENTAPTTAAADLVGLPEDWPGKAFRRRPSKTAS